MDVDAPRIRPIQPIGVIILAWLHLVAGFLALALMALMPFMGKSDSASGGLSGMGGALPWLVLAGVFLIVSLGLASGGGMLMGKRWGWYLGSFYYIYSVTRNTTALLMIHSMAADVEDGDFGSRGPGYYYAKHGGRIVISVLIYLYFFKSNVREYFGVAEQAKWKPLLVESVICVAITLASSLISMVGD